MPQCKAVATLRKKDDDEDDQEARGGASKRQKTVQEAGQSSAAVNRRKRAPGGRNDTSSGGKAKKKASSGHNQTEGADVTNLKPTLLTLPWSRDIPSRDGLVQHLRRFAEETHHALGMYHLYLVSD